MESLAVKYRPKTFEDVTSQSDTIAILKNQLLTNNIRNSYLFCGASGCGKALRNGTMVYTDSGLKEVEKLEVGKNKILSPDGYFKNLNGVYPQGFKQVMRVRFDCGMFTDCCKEHLWKVKNNEGEYLFTTEALYYNMERGKKYWMDLGQLRENVPNIEYPPIDFYIFISNYCAVSDSNGGPICVCTITSNTIRDWVQKLSIKYKLSLAPTTNYGRLGKVGERFTVKGDILKKYPIQKWWDAKHLPPEYFLMPYEARMELVNTFIFIGYTSKTLPYSVITTMRFSYLKDIRTVCHSVGVKASLRINPDGIPKLMIRNKDNIKYNYIRIRSIMNMGYDEEMTCISVDSEDGLFVLEGGIVTHNTTVARIFANELNENKSAPIEMDAASNNGVEDVRKLIESAKFKNISGEYKVFIIDECHSISTNGFQALLKILEEPPAKTIFIMCTTEPHKLPKTILNRVQRFDFYRMKKDDIEGRLKYILKAENIKTFDKDALEYIARVSYGGMRDAISYLDKVLLMSSEVTLENTIKALSLCEYDLMFQVIENLNNTDKLLEIVEKIHMDGKSLKNFIEMLIQFTIDFIKLQLGLSFDSVTIPKTYENYNYTEQKDLRDFLKKLMQLNVNLRYETNPKMLLDAFFIGVSTNVQ